jgi:hypothetical protein
VYLPTQTHLRSEFSNPRCKPTPPHHHHHLASGDQKSRHACSAPCCKSLDATCHDFCPPHIPTSPLPLTNPRPFQCCEFGKIPTGFPTVNPATQPILEFRKSRQTPRLFGGDDRDRTGNLRLAKPALSQLSYIPKMGAPRVELGTSALSELRSNQLSYAPANSAARAHRNSRPSWPAELLPDA